MQSFAPIRRLTALSLLVASLFFCTLLPAQRDPGPPVHMPPEAISTLPSSHPTTQPPATPQQSPAPPITPPASSSQPQLAEVTYSQGLLTVSANNSSLNQILRDISRKIGMTISGGVADERVFGHYGPSAPGPVLGALLDGTSSNMIFIREQNGHPSQLILTTRNGGPTPPNPNAAREREEEERRQEVYAPPVPTPNESQPPPQQNPAPPQQNQATPVASPAPTADSGGTPTDQQSPNGVKTPQQIYDQLLKLRQGQSNPPANTNPQ